jgi:regulator of sigma E protease
MTGLLFQVIKGLILGEYSIKTLGGPVLIAQVAGQAAETGFTALFGFVAFLSLQLGIINLFPIPVLDGGHLLFYAIELVRGRPVNEKVIGVAQQIGVAMLIALMLLVTWNDLLRVFG